MKQRVDFFEIFDKIDNLAFRLQLSFVMKIHSIVFIAQLKSITLDQNLYDKSTNKKSSFVEEKNSIIVKTTSHYEIERLLDKRIIKKHSHYLVKWKKYENEHNVWYFFRALNDVDELMTKYEIKTTNEKIKSTITRRDKKRFKDKKWWRQRDRRFFFFVLIFIMKHCSYRLINYLVDYFESRLDKLIM